MGELMKTSVKQESKKTSVKQESKKTSAKQEVETIKSPEEMVALIEAEIAKIDVALRIEGYNPDGSLDRRKASGTGETSRTPENVNQVSSKEFVDLTADSPNAQTQKA